MMMIQRLNYERGGLDLDVRTRLDGACGAIYRKSTPKPFKLPEHEPGPDYYYPEDDITRAQPYAFTFAKQT